MSKADKFRDLSMNELRGKETELADRVASLRVQKTIGQLENPAKLRQARHDLARVLTVMRERSSADGEAAVQGS